MSRQHTIYLICIDAQPAYVGQTIRSLGERLGSHRRAHTTTAWSVALDAAIARGAKVTIEPLDYVPYSLVIGDRNPLADQLENTHIRQFLAAGHLLFNRQIDGKYAPESRRRISAKTSQQNRTGGLGIGILQPVAVRNVDSGEVFPSISAAARSIGALQSSLTLAIKRGHRCHRDRFEVIANAA